MIDLSQPISFIIDDSAPCINVFYYHAAEKQQTYAPTQKSGEPVILSVPNEFIHEFVDVIQCYGIKGKFTVLPYPGGLGSISEGLPICLKEELSEWLDITRRKITPLFDITPEILTHAKALNLKNNQLLVENEREWATHQTEATLTPYIAYALRILRDVGLDATGVTSPWDFGRPVEKDYQQAILNAQKQVNNRRHTWYFLHTSMELTFQSKVVYLNSKDDEWVVSIVSQCDDFLWRTMETQQTDEKYIRSVADYYLTENEKGGRLVQLLAGQIPIIFHTHWQSLFSNGRCTGLKILREVAERIERLWGNKVRWVKCSELADEIAKCAL